MKKLLYSITLFFFVLNASAERVMLAEGEIIVLDTISADKMPVQQNELTSQGNQTSVESNKTPDTIQDEQSGYSQGSVTRSIFTSEVADHEPIDKLEKVPTDNSSVYYFTELRDMSGQIATHRWEFNGNVMAETRFTISGPRWRVWSSKNLLPSWTGEWKVSVLNGVGDVISEDVFSYVATQAPSVNTQQSKESDVPAVNSSVEESYTNDNLNP